MLISQFPSFIQICSTFGPSTFVLFHSYFTCSQLQRVDIFIFASHKKLNGLFLEAKTEGLFCFLSSDSVLFYAMHGFTS